MGAIPRFVKKDIIDKWIADGGLYLMLLTSAHVINEATQQYRTHVLANEITDSGGVYAPGGVPLAGLVQSWDPLDNTHAFLDANDVSIGPGATITYRYGVIYRNTGNAGTSPILAHVDFLADQTVTNGTSVIQWNSLGIIYIQ